MMVLAIEHPKHVLFVYSKLYTFMGFLIVSVMISTDAAFVVPVPS